MQIEKVIVFGLGRDFEQYKQLIVSKFQVVACMDNFVVPRESFWRDCYVSVNNINELKFDKILICSRKYQDAIKIQLIKMGVSINDMIYPETLQSNEIQSNYEQIIKDMELYKAINTDKKFEIEESSLYLIANDKDEAAGIPSHHYFAQDIWGGNKVYSNKPARHYDIGSRLDGFIAHLLTFREVYYIDVRPLPYDIPGLHFTQGDATTLDQIEDETVESLSCFHAMEHFGLGRYGDKVEPDAYRKAAKAMQRVLKKGGRLYIGVPIAPKDRLVFNAHRLFSIQTILELFDEMKLEDMAVIKPEGVMAESISTKDEPNIEEGSCGLFEFVKSGNTSVCDTYVSGCVFV